jgi:Fe-Mn family superoxide dismutase
MFILPELPYAYDALEPAMSAETLRLHHDKHHAKYVETTNSLVEGSSESLEDVVRRASGKLFNNAAQAWNHAFFWEAMSPTPGKPIPEVDADVRKRFIEEGVNHFASGWVWLAKGPDGLEVLSTHDGDNLLKRTELTPLLVCDLWEHAYYVDYRNDRKAFLEAWFDKLANWEFAARQLEKPWRYPAPQAQPERRSA